MSGQTKHQARFQNWQNLAPESTCFLSSEVASRLFPSLAQAGFERVDITLKDTAWPVSGRELEFERWRHSYVDSISYNFDKNGSPRFQVQASRRSAERPNAFIRSGNLVRRPSQYLHFWGKRWWLPLQLWSQRASVRTVAQVSQRVGQLVTFLELGDRGSFISRATN